MWWYTPVIPELWRLRLEDHEFETNVGYIVRFCLKKKKKKEEELKVVQPGENRSPQSPHCFHY
jgi:hypothetical protein